MVVASAGGFTSGQKWYLWVEQGVLFTLTEFGPKGIKGRNVMQLKRCAGRPTRHRMPKLLQMVKLGKTSLPIYDMMGLLYYFWLSRVTWPVKWVESCTL